MALKLNGADRQKKAPGTPGAFLAPFG